MQYNSILTLDPELHFIDSFWYCSHSCKFKVWITLPFILSSKDLKSCAVQFFTAFFVQQSATFQAAQHWDLTSSSFTFFMASDSLFPQISMSFEIFWPHLLVLTSFLKFSSYSSKNLLQETVAIEIIRMMWIFILMESFDLKCFKLFLTLRENKFRWNKLLINYLLIYISLKVRSKWTGKYITKFCHKKALVAKYFSCCTPSGHTGSNPKNN